MFNGDCCELIRDIPSDSVGYSVFSPPFASLYAYSDSPRDFGNCLSYRDFFDQFSHLVSELYRVLMPGRLVSMHCMNLPTTKQHHGEIGIQDFRGDLIRAMIDDEAAEIDAAIGRLQTRARESSEAGDVDRCKRLYEMITGLSHELAAHAPEKKFIFHSEVCIWKDPVTAMQRTKAIGLLHKQMVKDSALSRQGIPDYVVTFRKPGVNPVPVSGRLEKWAGDDSFSVTGDRSIDLWQRYASPVWMDINPSRTLQYTTAREENDEKHICVASGTLVLTERGYRPINEIEVGELVLTHRGRWKRVLAKRCNGIEETVRLHAQGVPGLVVTPDHKVLSRSATGVKGGRSRKNAKKALPKWVDASSTLGDYVNLPLPPVEETEWTETEWWIAGRWLADGHWDKCDRPGLHISVGRHKFDALMGVLGDYSGTTLDTGTSLQVRLKDRDGRLRKLISLLGRGASGKVIPREALSLDVSIAKKFLDGYFSGDGHYVEQYDRMTAESVSRPLLLGIAMISQRVFGVAASVYAGRPAGVATIEGRVVNTRDSWILSVPPRNISGFNDSDGAWKKVRKISPAGLNEVWDIQVEEDESFIAEGCAVHNCPLQLDVIERCMELWSMPDDLVLTPFLGIGSEAYVAVKNGRKAIGFELKESYYSKAVENCRLAEQEASISQKTLF